VCVALSWRVPKRSFKGTCALCGTGVDKGRSVGHSGTCAAAHDVGQSRATDLLTFRITAVGAPEYWLDIEADAEAALSKLDTFLRETWLECCGHLSMFSVSPYRYSSSPSDLSGFLGRANPERSMRAKIGEVFNRTGDKGTYDYDFGSTTRLTIARTGAREGGSVDRPSVCSSATIPCRGRAAPAISRRRSSAARTKPRAVRLSAQRTRRRIPAPTRRSCQWSTRRGWESAVTQGSSRGVNSG
jgi:hypothetical protein